MSDQGSLDRRRVRSGRHITLVGNVWYYRRVVPANARWLFGVSKVKKSLHTSNENEALRLEKIEDVEFEEKLRQARQSRSDGRPTDDRERASVFALEILDRGETSPKQLSRALSRYPKEDRELVREVIERLGEDEDRSDDVVDQFWEEELRDLLLRSADSAADWQQQRREIVALIEGHRTQSVAEHTLAWAYVQWKKSGNRPPQTEKDANDYLDDFQATAHVKTLTSVRRVHVTGWRDELKKRGTPEAATIEHREARKLSPKSINHRLEIVSAILRGGWRDAEMPAPDLKKINLPEIGSSGRGAWDREELLKELRELERRSGPAWVFVIGLSTSTRLGEIVAARKAWYNRNGFIEVPPEYTKMKKPHVVPIIDLIREPFLKHIEGLKDDDYMFDVPRPNNPKLKVSHEASKWFSRFHAKHQIPRVIHELRHSWIAAARLESPVKEEVWEIISGHSKKTVADGYGGEKPIPLMAANETICEHLLDAEMRAAILRLVA